MQELEYFANIFANRHLFSWIIKNYLYILPNLYSLSFILILAFERNKRKENRYNVFDIKKFLLRRHVKPSFLLNSKVKIFILKLFVYFCLSLLINSWIFIHFIIFFNNFLIVQLLVNYIGKAITKIYEVAYN